MPTDTNALPTLDRLRLLRPSDMEKLRVALRNPDGHWAFYRLLREYLVQWRNPSVADLDEIGGVAAQLSQIGLEAGPDFKWFFGLIAGEINVEVFDAFFGSLSDTEAAKELRAVRRQISSREPATKLQATVTPMPLGDEIVAFILEQVRAHQAQLGLTGFVGTSVRVGMRIYELRGAADRGEITRAAFREAVFSSVKEVLDAYKMHASQGNTDDPKESSTDTSTSGSRSTGT